MKKLYALIFTLSEVAHRFTKDQQSYMIDSLIKYVLVARDAPKLGSVRFSLCQPVEVWFSKEVFQSWPTRQVLVLEFCAGLMRGGVFI